MKCWNCLLENERKAHRCRRCDQPLEPNAAQRISSRRNLDYLIREMEAWTGIDKSIKAQLRAVYEVRSLRLEDTSAKKQVDWPTSDWVDSQAPIKAAEAVLDSPRNEESRSPALVDEAPTVTPSIATPKPQKTESDHVAASVDVVDFVEKAPQPKLLESLVGEADIRWFHSLGALLVTAAVVGWLRASWDSYGKTMTGFLIAVSPVIIHWVSSKLKRSVPLSSRLLAILANVLTPPALLAIDVFGALPPSISSEHYWTFALSLSAAILCWQAHASREKVPLFVGALCAIMAGWSQGALATAAFSLGIGFLYSTERQDEDEAWCRLRKQVSFYAGSFGALTTLLLFDTAKNPTVPLAAFTISLVFLHLPNLVGKESSNAKSRLFLQTVFTIIGSLLMRLVFELPAGGVALYLLFAASLFLTVKAESEIASATVKIAGAIGFLALLMGFISDLDSVLAADQTLPKAVLRFAFAAVGAGYFALISRKQRDRTDAQSLFLLSTLCLLGGWIHFFFYFVAQGPLRSHHEFLPLLAGIPLFGCLLLVASRWLKEQEQEVINCLIILTTLLSLSLSLAGRVTEFGAGRGWDWVLVIHGLFVVVWERGWLAPLSLATETVGKLTRQLLPRYAAVAFISAALSAVPFSLHPKLVGITAALVALTLILKHHYRDACWEGAWLLTWSGLALLPQDYWWLLIFAVSCPLALAQKQRKQVSLAFSCLLGLICIGATYRQVPLHALYLPALLYALMAMLPARPFSKWEDVGISRWGFDLLLSSALLLSGGFGDGSPGNLLYLFSILLIALSFHKLHTHPLGRRVLSVHSSAVLLGALLLWSLDQTTLETSLLLLGSGIAVMVASVREHRWEVGNGLLIAGLGQIATQSHFLLDPSLVALGVILSECVTTVTQRASNKYSNLLLLVTVLVQGQDSVLPQFATTLLLSATLFLAARAVQQNQLPVAAVSTILFLGRLDAALSLYDLDLKLRLLPMASLFIAAAIWKWETAPEWPQAALKLGLGLCSAPAILQFISGYRMLDNFGWTLAAGVLFLALSFGLSDTLGRTFRQAGGYTLIAWAIVSLTRAALSLPWQAATLVIGLALVGAGVLVEQKRKKTDTSDTL